MGTVSRSGLARTRPETTRWWTFPTGTRTARTAGPRRRWPSSSPRRAWRTWVSSSPSTWVTLAPAVTSPARPSSASAPSTRKSFQEAMYEYKYKHVLQASALSYKSTTAQSNEEKDNIALDVAIKVDAPLTNATPSNTYPCSNGKRTVPNEWHVR